MEISIKGISGAIGRVAGRSMTGAVILGALTGLVLAFGVFARDARADTKADLKTSITIDNFTFVPAELSVPVGTTVTWVNHDDIPHSVVEKTTKFRSKALDTNDAFSFTFATAGTFDYFCGLHPHMVGKVVVKP